MRFLFLVSGIGMVFVGVLSFLIWNKRRKVDFSFYLLGGACWVGAIVLKFGFAAIFNQRVKVVVEGIFKGLTGNIVYYIYTGLLTGIFECGMVLLFLFIIKSLKEMDFEETVAFGIGFGAIEAIVLGFSSIVSVTMIALFPESMPAKVLNMIDPSKLWVIPAPIVERISAIIIHIFSTALIVYAFLTKRFRWFWASFVYKTFVDSIAAWFSLNGYGGKVTELYLLELEFVIIALFGYIGLKILKEKWQGIKLEGS